VLSRVKKLLAAAPEAGVGHGANITERAPQVIAHGLVTSFVPIGEGLRGTRLNDKGVDVETEILVSHLQRNLDRPRTDQRALDTVLAQECYPEVSTSTIALFHHKI
jgi:hypothetical protein